MSSRERLDPALEQDHADQPIDPQQVILEEARNRFKAIQDGDKKQREREQEDLRFYAGDQWPADVVASRAGQNASNGLPAVPARPCLVINKARGPVLQVLAQEAQSDLGVTLVPADDFGELGANPITDDEIYLREGLVRRLQRNSDASTARKWAFKCATIAGRGYYGVMTRYAEGRTRDQEIYVRRFYNPASVSLGPHEEPDGSDAEYGFVGDYVEWEQFKRDHPTLQDGSTNPLIQSLDDSEDFIAEGEDFPDWFKTDGEIRMIHVAEYWRVESEPLTVVFLSDGRDVYEDELTDADKPLMNDVEGKPIGSKTDTRRVVKFCKIAGGTQILEETDWPGKYLPIIKVLGEELPPYDSERRCEGMIRPGRDSNVGFNYMVSKLVETVGLTPIPPLILDPESIEGWEAWYQNANTRTLPYLPQRTRGDDGREFREAHRPSVDPNLQPMALAIGLFNEFQQSTMGVHEPSLGKVDPRLKSAKAIDSVVAQDAHSTSNYIDNLAKSVNYEGKVLNDLLYPVYGTRPGRLAKIVNGLGESEPILLNQPFQMSPNGQPMPMPIPEGGQLPEGAKHYTLTKDANLQVAVKVTKNFDLKREQTAQFLGRLVESNPAFMAQYGDMFFKSIDVPEHQEMAERAKMMLDPRILQSLDAKQSGSGMSPAALAHMQQLQKQLKELEQIAHVQQQKLETEQVKSDANLKKAEIDRDKDIRLKELELAHEANESEKDRAAKIEIARISASKQPVDLEAERAEERMALGTELAHDAEQKALDRQHDLNLADQGHAQTLEQTAQSAALEPAEEPESV